MKCSPVVMAVSAVLGLGLLVSCAPEVGSIQQAVASPGEPPVLAPPQQPVACNSAEVINYVTAMYQKMDPNQNIDSPVGPYEGTGYRPGGQYNLISYLSGVVAYASPRACGPDWCSYLSAFQIDLYFMPEASRTRSKFERDWQILLNMSGCT